MAPSPAPEPAQPVVSAASADAARPALATLEIIAEGVLKGRRFEVRTPLVHVGRGAHNDVVIPDDSVSDSHAKLQKRDDGWHVVDISSTNGTYVGGRRIQGEAPLVGAPDVRFGGIKMVFRPNATAGAEVKGTRAIAGPDAEQLRKAAEWQRKAAEDARKAAGPAGKSAGPMRKEGDPSRRPVAPAIVPTPAPETPRGLPVWVWAIAFLLVVALVVFFFQGTR